MEQLIDSVRRIGPDLVVVSGDLTQRAKPREFQAAAAFLRALPSPQIVVPGNHDVPLYNLYARLRGFHLYRRYIADDLQPFYLDSEIAVAGVNTARRMTIKGGRIKRREILRVEQQFCPLPEGIRRILVTHHPFDLPPDWHSRDLAGHSSRALTRLLGCGLDLLLAGHMHISASGSTAVRLGVGSRSAMFLQAGTACSTRGRGEPNSYNVIRLDGESMEIEVLSAGGAGFESSSVQRFCRSRDGWSPEP